MMIIYKLKSHIPIFNPSKAILEPSKLFFLISVFISSINPLNFFHFASKIYIVEEKNLMRWMLGCGLDWPGDAGFLKKIFYLIQPQNLL